MKLDKCLRIIHAEQDIPSDWTIRFYDSNNIAYGNNSMIPTTIGIDDIYKDWYGNCDSCPENGEFIFGITIAQESTGRSYLIETNCEYTFEELMMRIEKEFYKDQASEEFS